MKILVCGGRDYQNGAVVWRELDAIHAATPITALMQGGASGADRLAKEWAATKPEIQRYVCHAYWWKFGPRAGPIRNRRMIEWKPDLVVAFPGGKGTQNMITLAREAGIEVLKLPS